MRMALRYVASTGSKWILMTVLFPVCVLSGCTTPDTIPRRDMVRTPDAAGVPGEPRIEPSSQETMVEIPVTAMPAYSATQASNPTQQNTKRPNHWPMTHPVIALPLKPPGTCRPLRL